MKISLIGSFPPPEGGTTLLLEQLESALSDFPKFSVSRINLGISNSQHLRSVINAARSVSRIYRSFKHDEIVTAHLSPRGAIILLPFLIFLGRLFKRPWLLRLFGGDSDLWFSRSSLRGRISLMMIQLCPLLLVETHALKYYFERNGVQNCAWFPNTRKFSYFHSHSNKDFPRTGDKIKLIFVGRVARSKGVMEAIEAAKILGDTTSLAIFGPVEDDLLQNLPFNVTYEGVIDSRKVSATIQQYDCLILPTYYTGEGYPGVIIEALSVGVPVISTRWRAIPEILDARPWMLCEPGSVVSLLSAIASLREALSLETDSLTLDCLAIAEKFDSGKWDNVFVGYCKSLIEKYCHLPPIKTN